MERKYVRLLMTIQKPTNNILGKIPLFFRLAALFVLLAAYVLQAALCRIDFDSQTLKFQFSPLFGYWPVDAAALVAFVWLIYLLVKAEIRLLLDYDDADHDTGRAVNFLVCSSVAILLAICGLLVMDFAGHMEDAEYKIKKEKFEKVATNIAINAQASAPQLANISPSSNTPTNSITAQEKPPEQTLLAKVGGFFGTFGDFFGGVLNPILTFGSLVALGVTMLQQRKQLRDARTEAAETRKHAQTQAFEHVFFNMLSLHAQNVQDLVFDPTIMLKALQYQPNLLERLRRLVTGKSTRPAPTLVRGRAVFAEVLHSTACGASAHVPQIEMYRYIQQQHNDVLGHYFRHLYQILAHIDSFQIDGRKADLDTKKRYSKILRAQLSSHELAVLLLNCTNNMVDEGAFQELVIRYHFLEHLPVIDQDGELLAPGLAVGSTELFFQYLDRDESNPPQPTPGAFGTNDTIKRFLARHQVPSWVTCRNPVN